jgi:hypothetical protein
MDDRAAALIHHQPGPGGGGLPDVTRPVRHSFVIFPVRCRNATNSTLTAKFQSR